MRIAQPETATLDRLTADQAADQLAGAHNPHPLGSVLTAPHRRSFQRRWRLRCYHSTIPPETERPPASSAHVHKHPPQEFPPVTARRPLEADWYDYPQYYDIAFGSETRLEADFIEAACRKYCPFPARRLLEPACGTGRLVAELAGRGYRVAGFDLNPAVLRYARCRLARRGLAARVFPADMAGFRLGRPVDAAYCPVNTFRHLLTEQAARRHLECVAEGLRPGGIYVLGLHLLPPDAAEEDGERWTARRGQTQVTVTLRVIETDRRRRIEKLRVSLLVRRAGKKGTCPLFPAGVAAAARVPLPHLHGRPVPSAAGLGPVARALRRVRFLVRDRPSAPARRQDRRHGLHFAEVCRSSHFSISSRNCGLKMQFRWPASLISTTGQSFAPIPTGQRRAASPGRGRPPARARERGRP